jgi:hypothetical protein
MQDFLNKVTTVQRQLGEIGTSEPEEVIRVMILMTLPEIYQSLVMGLKSMAPDQQILDKVTSRNPQVESRQQAIEYGHSKEITLNIK